MSAFKHFHLTFVYFSSCSVLRKWNITWWFNSAEVLSKLLVLKVEPRIHWAFKPVFRLLDIVQWELFIWKSNCRLEGEFLWTLCHKIFLQSSQQTFVIENVITLNQISIRCMAFPARYIFVHVVHVVVERNCSEELSLRSLVNTEHKSHAKKDLKAKINLLYSIAVLGSGCSLLHSGGWPEGHEQGNSFKNPFCIMSCPWKMNPLSFPVTELKQIWD